MISLHIDVHDVNQELHERFWKWMGQIKSQLFSGVAGTCTFILFSDVYKRYTYEGPTLLSWFPVAMWIHVINLLIVHS